jgi:hypothetical protein
VTDELLTAEGRAELTPEQRQGLLYYLNQLRDNLASNYGGSREEANAKLQEREGRTFEGQVDEEMKQALQRSVLNKYVRPRVNPSWRDVVRQYEKETEANTRQSVAVVRMIQVDARDTAAIDSISAALAAGKPFAQAGDVPANQWPAQEAGRGVFEWPFTGEYASAALSSNPAINKVAQTLTPGGVTGPFDYKTTRDEDVKIWMRLEEIRAPQVASLEEVQLRVYNDLVMRKFREVREKYMMGLMEKASYTPMDEMGTRLMTIAAERYPRPGAQR